MSFLHENQWINHINWINDESVQSQQNDVSPLGCCLHWHCCSQQLPAYGPEFLWLQSICNHPDLFCLEHDPWAGSTSTWKGRKHQLPLQCWFDQSHPSWNQSPSWYWSQNAIRFLFQCSMHSCMYFLVPLLFIPSSSSFILTSTVPFFSAFWFPASYWFMWIWCRLLVE